MQSTALGTHVLVGIVGAGTMGAGIAQAAATAGHVVKVFDSRAGAAAQAIESVGQMLGRLLAKGQMTEHEIAGIGARLSAVDSLEQLAECGLVIEAIVEDLDAKRRLFRNLETCIAENGLLATNTSSLSVTAIASALKHPERVAGMHFFNPAPLMPLVEIVSGAATASSTASTLYATASSWGKTPVHARSTPGFIVNRVARPFYGESLRVLQEGGAEPATIDAIMRECGGFRMGPFELMDLIGHDVNYAVTCSVFDALYGDPRYTPSLLQRELVQAGFLGRKSGRGFYRYDEGAARPLPATVQCGIPDGPVELHGSSALTRVLAQRLTSRGVAFEQRDTSTDGRMVTLPSAVLYTCDGRTATARAAETGEANTVLLDLALDYATAKRVAVTAADQACESALTEVAEVFTTAGYAVSPVDDVPGMVMVRTVAMLANAAADAVDQQVCGAADCDVSMRKGVSYPRGPLEWAEALGLPFVVSVLEHLQAGYGEDRYRVSPLLRRKALAGGTFFAKAALHG